jgi:hypothetical protein
VGYAPKVLFTTAFVGTAVPAVTMASVNVTGGYAIPFVSGMKIRLWSVTPLFFPADLAGNLSVVGASCRADYANSAGVSPGQGKVTIPLIGIAQLPFPLGTLAGTNLFAQAPWGIAQSPWEFDARDFSAAAQLLMNVFLLVSNNDAVNPHTINLGLQGVYDMVTE